MKTTNTKSGSTNPNYGRPVVHSSDYCLVWNIKCDNDVY